MPSTSPHLRVLPPPAASDAPPRRAGTVDGVTVFLLAVGLLPFAGQALVGGWSERELGASAAVALLALAGLRPGA